MATDWHASCRKLLDAGRNAVAWINDPGNASTVGVEKQSADKRLRRIITEVSKLDQAVDRPMCVGVFGPSQAGKSYLVSILARKGQTPLTARFSGIAEPIDFIREINPGGERESTGIVTRFSLRDIPSPDGFPVCLRLLSETDIVKILGNSYFLDGEPKKQMPPEREALQSILREASQLAAGRGDNVPDNRLSVEDVWDLQDYFERTFEGTRTIDALRIYWDEASQLAPKLTIPERGRLFSVLWGGYEAFTGLYVALVQALSSLGFSRDAFCRIEALLPRTESIIDVQTLTTRLGRDGEPGLEVKGSGGMVVSLPRSIATALVAELHITMTERPWPFMEHTDLLDFPGARSRQPLDLYEQFETESGLANLFLRGKVAYLFERYVAEQELTSMLLCIKPSNQEVTSLPNMIGDWVAKTHGSTPQARAGKTTVLFLILTMFDSHFVDKAGEDKADPGDRFKNRLYSSIDGFSKAHNWPGEWTPGEAFKNIFWLRNPNYPAESIIEYGPGGVEVDYRADRREYVQRLREGYLRVPTVQQHFKDPARAFDEALKLNDGGVSYLAEQLEPVCRPGLKYEQIASRLKLLRGQLTTVVASYYVSSDIDKRLEERRIVCGQVLQHAQRLGAEQRFADLLAALQVSQHGFSDILYNVHVRRSRERKETESGDRNGGRKSVSAPQLMPMPGIPPLPGMPPLPTAVFAPPALENGAGNGAAPAAIRHNSASHGLAQAAVGFWIDVMRSNAENDILGQYFMGDHKTALELVSELAGAARRMRLDQVVAETLDRVGGSVTEELDMTMEKAAFVCALTINRFVTRFGFEALAEEQRPLAPNFDGSMTPIFGSRTVCNSAREMPLQTSHQGYEALSQWMYAFHRLVEDNARSVDGLDIDVEQNMRLGAILTVMSSLETGDRA